MGTPITCKVDYGKEEEGKVYITGSFDVIWNHRHGEPIDVVGFEIDVAHNGDSMSFHSAEQHTGNSEVITALEEVLGESLVDAAGNHCDHEPPTDGTIQEQTDYKECFDDFYPPIPRG